MDIKQHADGTMGFINEQTSAEHRIGIADITITSAQLKALNATPVQLIAAPGTNLALVCLGAIFYLPYNTTAYATPAAASDLGIKYTNGSGAEASARVETTGLLDASSSQLRYVGEAAKGAVGAVGDITPVANAALVLHNLSATEYTTGDSPLKVRVFYKVISTVF